MQKSQLTTGDMYRLASEFAEEHGENACDYAWRAVMCFEAEGSQDRAHFWFLLLIMLGDIAHHGIEPGGTITIH